MTTATEPHPEMTMAEILEKFPGARRALFQRYHIGGCSSCGFQPTDTLRRVLANHNVSDVDSAVGVIKQFDEMDRKLQISPKEVVELRKQNPKVRLVDVRSPEEHNFAHIEGAELLTQDLVGQLMSLPKDSPLVFHCHHGVRSLDAAAYFVGHGFTNCRSMVGGIHAWSEQVDPRVLKY
jgi:rhodanese-related sulfurtransferase